MLCDVVVLAPLHSRTQEWRWSKATNVALGVDRLSPRQKRLEADKLFKSRVLWLRTWVTSRGITLLTTALLLLLTSSSATSWHWIIQLPGGERAEPGSASGVKDPAGVTVMSKTCQGALHVPVWSHPDSWNRRWRQVICTFMFFCSSIQTVHCCNVMMTFLILTHQCRSLLFQHFLLFHPIGL